MADKHGIGTFVSEVHELASESIDLFSLPPIETSAIHGKTQTIYPTSVLTDAGPYEFLIPSDSNDFTYLPLTRLEGELEIVKSDGEAIAAADVQSFVNLLSQAIFKQVECSLNGVQINDLSTPTYHYKAFIETHLTYDTDLKDTTLAACELYNKDTVGKENTFSLTATSDSFYKRKTAYIGKKICFNSILHIDFFQSTKYLLPGCDIKLKFIRSDDSFALLGNALLGKIKVNKLLLSVRRITLDPAIAGAIENRLKTVPAYYPIVSSKIKNFLITSGTQSTVLSQVIRGKLPRSFIVSFVSAKAYDGHITKNPFVFENFLCNSFNALLNGEPIVPTLFQPNFETDECIKMYRWMNDNIGLHQNMSNGITFEEFKKNSCFFAFDLSPDLCNNVFLHGIENGTIDLQIGFKTALTENVMVLLYASYDELISIDTNRNVLIN